MKTLLIDNYDSFTFNVFQYLSQLGTDVTVFRNDKITVQEALDFDPDNVVISPGPGHPSDAGVSMDVIKAFAGKKPILGVCLGEQSIFEAFGGTVGHAGEIVHGKTSPITHDEKGLYAGVHPHVLMTRYHSLTCDKDTVPDELEVTSTTASGLVMGVRHRKYKIEGVQYHPESVSSESGMKLFENFLKFREPGQVISSSPVAKKHKAGEPTILEKIVAQRRVDVENAQQKTPLSALKKGLSSAPRLVSFVQKLNSANGEEGKMAVIAEIKRASPSKGDIAPCLNAADQGAKYASAGVAAISVLTEPTWFKGTLDDMLQVRKRLEECADRPAILRKDFVIDEYQVYEARVYGADTLLLIVKSLSDDELRHLLAVSRSLGMEPLVEVQNEEEMGRAMNVGAAVVGINNRNLNDFTVDLSTTNRLSSFATEHVLVAALSGINTRSDVEYFEKAGAKVILVGEALMRAECPKAKIHELLGSQTSPLVKICGIMAPEMGEEVVKAGADFVGLVFAPSSRRVTVEQAQEIAARVRHASASARGVAVPTVLPVIKTPPHTDSGTMAFFRQWTESVATSVRDHGPLLVGVFVNESTDTINATVKAVGLDLVQLCGSEGWQIADSISVPVIRTVHVASSGGSSAEVLDQLVTGHAAAILLDTKVKGSLGGGTGTAFNWDIAARLAADGLPVVVAGGLDPTNVAKAVRTTTPWAVDVSSGVETSGSKDLRKVVDFVREAKSAL